MKRLFMVFAVLCLLQAAIAAAASFTDNGNGTVTDNGTGLMWQQGERNSRIIWAYALIYCEKSSLGGRTDWRLPNITELESIIDDTKYEPAIDTAYFPNAYADYYWSSTTSASNTNGAWSVEFGDNYVYYGSKSYGSYVRCVRGGQ